MAKTTESVLADALSLDQQARAEIAAEPIASLDRPADPDSEAAWEGEMRRRVAAFDDGAMPVEPWGGEAAPQIRLAPAVTIRVQVGEPADVELSEAVRWYELQREGLGTEFLEGSAGCSQSLRSSRKMAHCPDKTLGFAIFRSGASLTGSPTSERKPA